MKPERRDELFRYYAHYWIIKLNLDDKYNFIIKRDNRIDCLAYILPVTGANYTYYFKYNTKKLTTKWKIICTVLHEIGHVLHDLRTGTETEHEFVAEFFALKTAKEFYPTLYPKMVNWTKLAINKKNLDKEHKQGYIKALEQLGEL